jgi:AraC-like DNA-binding protein
MKQRDSSKKSSIPIHRNELTNINVKISAIRDLVKMDQVAHRDDHYMFIILQQGLFLWELDFKEVCLEGASLCFVAPGQVHRYIDFKAAKGWLVFVDAAMISGQSREVLETLLYVRQFTALEMEDPVLRLLPLLQDMLENKQLPLQKSLITSLTDTLGALVASKLIGSQQSLNPMGGRKQEIMIRFRQLVADKCNELKYVKDYADLLHITRVYLNEVAKTTTGFPASYWIDQEILLEAKRLLYYTTLEVRQIAYQLGYEDHAYFSRFFKKHTGMTAIAFRNAKP